MSTSSVEQLSFSLILVPNGLSDKGRASAGLIVNCNVFPYAQCMFLCANFFSVSGLSGQNEFLPKLFGSIALFIVYQRYLYNVSQFHLLHLSFLINYGFHIIVSFMSYLQ